VAFSYASGVRFEPELDRGTDWGGLMLIRNFARCWTVALAGFAVAAPAADYVTAPMVRVETGMHTGMIESVASDSANRFLVTGGRDKVARVWSLPDLELLQVLRPPIGEGDEGRVDTVAVAPDGSQIAVAGMFCRYERTFCVFVFERASGRIVKRITGFASNVRRLAWSPDGAVVAAGMGGKAGIRLLRTNDWTEIARDADYADFVTALSFGAGGQLAAASWDGKIRVYGYDTNSLTLKRAKSAGELTHTVYRNAQNRGRPSTLEFSPDGSKLVVGHVAGSNWVLVLSPATLDSLYMPSNAGLSNNVGGFGVRKVSWSPDGKTLYAGVASNNKVAHFVRVWGDSGRATPSDLPTPGLSVVSDIIGLRAGGVAFASGVMLGIYDARGNKQRALEVDGGSFYGTTELFKVSRDANRVQFAYDGGREVMNFDVLDRKLAAGPVKDIAMTAPETNTRSIKFYNQWRDTRGALELNGKLMQMDGFSRGLAIAPDESAVLVGTDARIYLYARDGAPLWNAQFAGNLAVNLSADNRFAVSAHGDGAVRWYRRSDGRLLLTLFVAADRKRWALVSPTGFYDTSVGGEELIGWHVNRARDEAADFFPVSRLRARFYKPEVIAGIIGKADDTEAFKLAALALGDTPPRQPVKAVSPAPVVPPPQAADKPPAKPVVMAPPVTVTAPAPVIATAPIVAPPSKPQSTPQPTEPPVTGGSLIDDDAADATRAAEVKTAAQPVTDITQVLPPVVTVHSPVSGSTVAANQVTIKYSVKSSPGAPVTAVRTRVNGVGKDSPNARAAAVTDVREITVTVPSEDSEVLVFAENKYGVSTPVSVRLKWTGAKPAPVDDKPVLYVLSIGVSEYIEPDNRLKFAAKDAIDFAAIVQNQKGKLYRDVVVKLLTDAKASRADVLAGFDWLQKQVTPKDVGIVLIAGHGINDDRGNYYYLPVNADLDKLETTGVPFAAIKAHLSGLNGKGLLFVDTCHSGNVMGKRRGFSTDTTAMLNELSSPEYGLVVIASSTGKQFSFENTEWGNGAFTKALVEGFSGRADLKKRGRITHKMLDFYVSDRVEELTQGKQTPVNTSPLGVPDYTIALIGGPG
jgi:hypothetical protein